MQHKLDSYRIRDMVKAFVFLFLVTIVMVFASLAVKADESGLPDPRVEILKGQTALLVTAPQHLKQ